MSSLSKSHASSSSDEDVELRRGPWTLEEDSLLIHYISCHGEGRWNLLAKRSGLRRTGKSCRLRWLNYLKPDVKRGNLTPEEQLLILELHSKWGNRWSKIAQHLPGRTDNEIKNYWRTRVQKQARHMKIDSNSTAFQEVIRCLWMPRLIQKIRGSSSSSSSSSIMLSQNSATTQPLINHSQVSPQGHVHTSETAYSLDHHGKNSSSERCTSPSVCSSDSMNISHVPQVYSEYPIQAMGNSTDYNTFLKGGCYNVDNISYDMESFSISSMADFENSIGNCHVNQTNWIDSELGDSLWNMDELWQFRQLQERGT